MTQVVTPQSHGWASKGPRIKSITHYHDPRPIKLPPQIMCSTCDKKRALKPLSEYSEVQLDKARGLVARHGRADAADGQISCKTCSTRYPTEFQCGNCDEWKVIDAFSKAQRKKNPDNPVCSACVGPQRQLSSLDQGDENVEASDIASVEATFKKIAVTSPAAPDALEEEEEKNNATGGVSISQGVLGKGNVIAQPIWGRPAANSSSSSTTGRNTASQAGSAASFNPKSYGAPRSMTSAQSSSTQKAPGYVRRVALGKAKEKWGVVENPNSGFIPENEEEDFKHMTEEHVTVLDNDDLP